MTTTSACKSTAQLREPHPHVILQEESLYPLEAIRAQLDLLSSHPHMGAYQELPITAHTLTHSVAPVSADTHNAEVYARFCAEPELRALPVVKHDKPLGMIPRRAFLANFETDALSACDQPCALFIDIEALRVNRHMPIEELAQYLVATYSSHAEPVFMITEQGRYIGIANARDLLHELSHMQTNISLALLEAKAVLYKAVVSFYS